ncbi:MAG TPA: response regulator [Bacteroidetes bacterium]|jgi:DNA-binding response OmpR family regulator|nr:response regulator [Bacteroidota bacterium]
METKMKIAVIDDEIQIIEDIKSLFEKEGYEVVYAQNVPDALSLIDRDPVDLIILDVMMQESDDGIYLANKFRQKGISTPIIMLACISKITGFNFTESDTLPIDEYLIKPVAPEYLLAKAKRFLNKN